MNEIEGKQASNSNTKTASSTVKYKVIYQMLQRSFNLGGAQTFNQSTPSMRI